jgi:tetratricopeptide (TPR) repeat protein
VREYSTREVTELTGLPEPLIRRWARARLITPNKDLQARWRYSFQDLALLRTAGKLLKANLSLNRITRTLRTIRKQVPAGRPLSAVRIVVTGRRVVVRDRLASWEPESRQGTLDFDVQKITQPIAPHIPRRSRAELKKATPSAEGLYQAALDLELAGRGAEARDAYEAALERDPKLVSARINLGRLMHAANRVTEAEALYRAALAQNPRSALAAFNLGVALEDQGAESAAIEAYEKALAIDASYADAHFNLSRLLEAKGDTRGALRHLNTFRRLLRQGETKNRD